MEELLDEVKKIIHVQQLNITRRKKLYEYPFTDNCFHYYQLMTLQRSLEVWEYCRELIEKYKKNRWGPIERPRSSEFETKMSMEIKDYPGVLTQKTREAMIEYMKTLEWRIEQLEGELQSIISNV